MARKICIVDDDRQVVTLATKIVESEGHEVTSFTDPVEAKTFLETNRVDLVLLDLIMPEVDGYELTTWMRESNPYTRIVNMTGSAQVLTLLGCWRAGSDSCVLKGEDFVPLLTEAIANSFRALEQWEKSIATVREASRIDGGEDSEERALVTKTPNCSMSSGSKRTSSPAAGKIEGTRST